MSVNSNYSVLIDLQRNSVLRAPLREVHCGGWHAITQIWRLTTENSENPSA